MKALVIGLGSIGKRHVNNLLSFPNIEVIVCTKRKDVKSFKKKCKVCSSLQECLAYNPDVAIITNVTSLHINTCIQLAKSGIDLLIEKPLSNSLHGCSKLLNLVKKHNLVTLMGCQLRFHKCIKEIKKCIYNGKIGKIISVQVENGSYLPEWHPYEDYKQSYAARKELGGGIVLTNIHEIDYLYWIFGQVKEVFSITGKYSDLKMSADDLSSIIMKFRNNVIAEVHLDHFQRPNFRSCKIIGTKGTLFWNSDDNVVKIYDIKKKRWIKKFEWKDYERNALFLDELSHFLQCVKTRTKTVNPLNQGIETLKIALGIMKSSKTKSVLKL